MGCWFVLGAALFFVISFANMHTCVLCDFIDLR